jgi:YbbR domain-containing protein
MQNRASLRQTIFNNLLWFLVSLVLAFTIWLLAISQRDPIEERRLAERAPIQFVYDQSQMLVINTSTETVDLRARGQRSALTRLTVDDVTVSADMSGLPPGTHQVPLVVNVQRERVSVDTVPRQVTVTLERVEARLVPVRVTLTGAVPAGFLHDEPALDILQATVTGAASGVARVDSASIEVELTNQRAPIIGTFRLTPVEADGSPVDYVSLTPDTVNLTLPIRQRPDVREVSVQPNIVGSDALPSGYLLTSLSYEPDSVLVSGPLSLLESLPETFFTVPIDLEGRTSAFEVSAPIELPSRELVLISDQTVTVTIGITAQTASRQFDGVRVEVIGLDAERYQVSVMPSEVTLLITGPQPIVAALRSGDVRVILDVSGLSAGSHQLIPQLVLAEGQRTDTTISVLPNSIDLTILDTRATPSPTPTR